MDPIGRARSLPLGDSTNSLRTVKNFKVLQLNMGVNSQTCHKVLELSDKFILEPVKNRIPPTNYSIALATDQFHTNYRKEKNKKEETPLNTS